MITPPLQDPIGGLIKRSFCIFRERPGSTVPESLACFMARDETLARMYAEILWPGDRLEVRDSEAVGYELRNRCRARFLLDCDLARETFDFVVASSTGAVCVICACTDLTPCAGGCYWVTPTLCSACCVRAGVEPVARSALELAKRETTPDVFPAELTFEPDPTVPQLMRNACFALAGGDARQCFELLVQAIAHLEPHAPMPGGGRTVLVNLRPDEEIRIIKKEPPHGPSNPIS